MPAGDSGRTLQITDDIAGLRRILTRSRVVAVVGLSANWYRPSYFAAKYLQDHGYRIIPVNPTYPELLGEKSYASVADIPEPVDIVDCEILPRLAHMMMLERQWERAARKLADWLADL